MPGALLTGVAGARLRLRFMSSTVSFILSNRLFVSSSSSSSLPLSSLFIAEEGLDRGAEEAEVDEEVEDLTGDEPGIRA
jgi:hypothetical protein